MSAAAARLPLNALLSAALVAYTIEIDNEAESRMPHRTSSQGQPADRASAPWLVSMAMWWNCLRFVGPDGITVGELSRLARTPTNLGGMQRWGYIATDPGNAQIRGRGRAGLVIRATAAGSAAQQVWQSLGDVMEQRWQDRFGTGQVTSLAAALAEIAGHLDPALPDCMPILGYGLFSRPGGRLDAPQTRVPPAGRPGEVAQLPLAALLARVLTSFAIEFERESSLSVAICANVLRVLAEQAVPVRDLPVRSGVSKESISMALRILAKGGLAVTESGAADGRGRVTWLTEAGLREQRSAGRLIRIVEERWPDRYGSGAVDGLRAALEPLAGDLSAQGSPLFRGLVPHPGNWRAATRQARVLPHFPMVLHRGGFPDGS